MANTHKPVYELAKSSYNFHFISVNWYGFIDEQTAKTLVSVHGGPDSSDKKQ